MARREVGAEPARAERLRAVVDACIAITSAELSLEGLLQTLAEKAAEVTGARYAAIGIVDRDGDELERFVAHGVDEATWAAIGVLPRGRGVLGALLDEARPIRLADLAQDPRAVGFPPGHPPMRTFLGVPILLRGSVYGNLYMAEKADGEFTAEDEELATLIAAQAAVAVGNSRLYETTSRWARRLESLQETGNALAKELDVQALLDLIATRLRELLEARVVAIALVREDGIEIRSAAGEGVDTLVGLRSGPESSKMARVAARKRSERVDSIPDDPEADRAFAAQIEARAGLYVPLVVGDRALGVLAAVDKERHDPRFSQDDVQLAELFATRAAIALELSERVHRESLRRVVEAQESERRRMARELHDQAGQALTSIIFGVRQLRAARDVADARRAAKSITSLVSEALEDIRRLTLELRPQILDDFGLVPALEHLTDSFADRTGLDVELRTPPAEQERLTPEQETTLYRAAQEALTNIAKHAQATHVRVELRRGHDRVELTVADNGRGLQQTRSNQGRSFGLIGMRERVALVGGSLQIESAAGAGTTVRVRLPVATGDVA
jgi:signal transduction histidine kinase